MRKLGLKLLLFFPIAFVTYCIGVILVGEYGDRKLMKNLLFMKAGPGHTYSRLRDADSVEDPELLIFGTSLAFKGFDTRIFERNGISTFNLGTAGETPLQTELIVNRYLDKINPENIIYELNPEWFTTGRIESAVDIISNLPSVGTDAIIMTLRINKIKVYNTLIYSFYKNNFSRDADLKEPVTKNGNTYIPGGGYVQSRMRYYQPDSLKKKKLFFLRDQKAAFERILRTIEEKGINLILIMPPLSDNLYASLENIEEIEEYFRSKGIYRNFNDLETLNDTLHFGDARHLNQKGVVIFNQAVIKYLKNDLHLFEGH